MYGINEKEKKKEIPYILDTLDFCYERKIPIFVLETRNAGDTIDPIKDRLDRYGACYIQKVENSGFPETSLDEELKRLDVKTLLLMGVNASVCVRQTAEDALELGYGVCTSRDLIAEPPVWHRGFKTYESISWFKKNGVYCDNYADLLHVIANSYEQKHSGTLEGYSLIAKPLF